MTTAEAKRALMRYRTELLINKDRLIRERLKAFLILQERAIKQYREAEASQVALYIAENLPNVSVH